MTSQQIVRKIYRLTNTNSTSYPNANILDDINIAYNKVWGAVITADGRWQLDDSNNTDFPIATTALVSGQNDYTLAASHLRISAVEIKLSNGQWVQLDPIDARDISDYGSSPSYEQTISAIPQTYDLIGSSVVLYPTPNYSQAASLKVWFERGPNEYTSAQIWSDGSTLDGVKQPGFNSLYHELIPLWVAYDFWLINDPAMTTRILNKIQLVEQTMALDYGTRDKDDRPQITTEQVNYM